MDRRNALKIAGILSFTGLASLSVYKYFRQGKNFDPQYFSDQKLLLSEMVECIIPATETPGAKEAMVHLFVIKGIQNCATAAERQTFYKGLEAFKTYCLSEYGQDFISCNEAERNEVMHYFDKQGRMLPGVFGKIQKRLMGESFFYLLRRYTVDGYCSSFLGATQNLRYDYIPVRYDPCISYTPGESSWATK